MPIFTIKTSQGEFEVDANRQPTPEEGLRLIQAGSAKGGTAPTGGSQSFAGFDPAVEFGGRVPGISGVGVDLALEVGLPAAAQFAAAPFSPAAQSVAGGVASSVGNSLAQLRRMASGEQKKFNIGENLQATALGAIPFAGPAKLAAGQSRGILPNIYQTAKTGMKLGGAGVAGEEARSLIDEGKLASGGRVALAGALPMGLTSAALPISFAGAKLKDYGNRAAASLAAFMGSGVKPTPGMLLGGRAATIEQHLARMEPSGKAAQRIDETYNQISSGLNAISPNPQEGAAIFKDVQPLIGQIRQSQQAIDGLKQIAAKHQEAVDQAALKLNQAQQEGLMVDTRALQEDLQRNSDAKFTATLSAITERAKQLATASLVAGEKGVNPAMVRDLGVRNIKDLEKAFEAQTDDLYKAVGRDHATQLVFDTKPLLDEADRLAGVVTAGLPKKLSDAIDMVKNNLGDAGRASLDQLRFLRGEIRQYARRANATDAEKRFVSQLGHSVTEQINAQAEKAFGTEGGKALKYANTFYAETLPLFDAHGVSQLLEAHPKDEYVADLLRGLEKSGRDSDEYKNIQNLIVKINEFSPEVAAAAKGQINGALRGSLIHDASTMNLDSPGGQALVNGGALAERLSRMEVSAPGTLASLGMGTPDKVAELIKLHAKYPDASNMTVPEWENLFSSPTFSGEAGKSLASQIQPKLAMSSAQNLVAKSAQLRAAGDIKQADDALFRAKRALGDISSDISAAQLTHDALAKNPVAMAFDNPNLPDSSFNAFKKVFFDPAANAVTNKDISAMVSSLEKSGTFANWEVLQKLRERYIADRIAAFKTAPATSREGHRIKATDLSEFFNPANPGDATNEIERAKAVLSKDQMRQLTRFAKVAKEIQLYERAGNIALPNASLDTPTSGQTRAGINMVGDLYRQGKYGRAAKLLADPEQFSKSAIVAGTLLDSVNSRGGQVAGLQITRYMMNHSRTPEDVAKAQSFLRWANRPKGQLSPLQNRQNPPTTSP